jgi:hypothetical protein
MAIAIRPSPYANVVHRNCRAKLGTLPEAQLPHLVALSWLIPVSLFGSAG